MTSAAFSALPCRILCVRISHVIPSRCVKIEESGWGRLSNSNRRAHFRSSSLIPSQAPRPSKERWKPHLGYSSLVVAMVIGMGDSLGDSTNHTGECREPGFPAGSLRVSLRKTFNNLPGRVDGNHQPVSCYPFKYWCLWHLMITPQHRRSHGFLTTYLLIFVSPVIVPVLITSR